MALKVGHTCVPWEQRDPPCSVSAVMMPRWSRRGVSDVIGGVSCVCRHAGGVVFVVVDVGVGVWVTGAARDGSSRATRPVLILGEDGSKALFFSQRECAMFLDSAESKISKSLRKDGLRKPLTGIWSTTRVNGYSVKLATFEEVMDNLDVHVDMHANSRPRPDIVDDEAEVEVKASVPQEPTAVQAEFTYHLTVNGSVVLHSAYGTLYFDKPENVPASLLALSSRSRDVFER